MRSRVIAVALASTLASFSARAARADGPADPPSLDLRGFRAPIDPESGLAIEPADSPGTGDFSAGLWLNYVYRPVVLKDPSTNDVAFKVITHQLTSDLTMGVGVGHRLLLGFDLPVLLYQHGDAPTPTSLKTLGAGVLPTQGLGDLGLDAKLTMLRPTQGEFGGLSLAFVDRLTLPTGDESSYLGEGSVTSETRLLAEYRVVALGVHASAGLLLRGEKDSFACASVPDSSCPSRFGHEIPFAFGFSFKPQALGIDDKSRWTWFLETYGYLPLSPNAPFSSAATTNASVSVAARYAFAQDFSALAGVAFAYAKGIGDAPFRGTLSVEWAPRNHDADNDGVPDDIDQCKDLPEDKDGFQDADGCPDLDNDDDGVPDAQDKCPTLKEDEDGFEDDDGCPDPDNDKDGIPDTEDACPNEAGPRTNDPKTNGCPSNDKDGDGIPDKEDACPDVKGSKSSDPKQNGCPNPDSDHDGIPDAEDACPDVKGVKSEDPKQNGCPDRDRDKDTILDPDDKCPDQPETFNGYQDEDGCPDERPKLLVTVKAEKNGGARLSIAKPISMKDDKTIDPASEPVLRAIAVELLKHVDWKVLVGAKPNKKGADTSKARAEIVAKEIDKLARRASAAEVGTFDDVKSDPNVYSSGIGIVLKTPGAAATTAAPKPAAQPKPTAAPKPKK